jgi:glucose-6-phosphate 1-dehydrogenase
MTSRIIAVEPFDLVVFGGTGDLAYRKLLPALYQRHLDGQLPTAARIIGVSRRAHSDNDYREAARSALHEHVAPAGHDPAVIETFLKRLHYVPVDAIADSGWDALGTLLAERPDCIRAFYLAVSPDLFGPISHRLGGRGLTNPETRVVIEKPIGHDLKSAMEINDAVGRVFSERQIYRIDHYLGKETVQNLMALRFANALFEPLWNATHIDHVQITVAESIGVEGRGAYYDHAGALRDIVQNHMMQLLCLVAMEPPAHMDADSVRDEKIKVLRSLMPIDAANALQLIIRGQYRAGSAGDGPVPAYSAEVGNAASTTETFVALKAQIQNWRWAGVPFYLRTASGCHCAHQRSSSSSGRSPTPSSTSRLARSRRTSLCCACSPTRGSNSA